jgi:hypothetical protein
MSLVYYNRRRNRDLIRIARLDVLLVETVTLNPIDSEFVLEGEHLG